MPGDAGGLAQAAGLRLGVSALTTRGTAEAECREIGGLVGRALLEAAGRGLQQPVRTGPARQVAALCARFPLYAEKSAERRAAR